MLNCITKTRVLGQIESRQLVAASFPVWRCQWQDASLALAW
jgi:hypothetical protein